MSRDISNEVLQNPAQMEKLMLKIANLENANKALVNAIRTACAGDYLVTSPSLGIGSTAQNVANVAFTYIINGTLYYSAAVAAGTAPGNDVVPQNLYGAVAFDIGTNGTIDAIEATANATGYATAALAVAGLPAVAADHCRMGYVTVMNTGAAFTFGTTALSDATTTEVYTNGPSVFSQITAAAAVSADSIEV